MRKLLFVHDQLPSEGISGQIIFLRHFLRLRDTEVHILIPQNAYRADIVKDYPKNFIVHVFPLRKFWWPPSRESNSFLLLIRIFLLSLHFKQIIRNISPDAVITVLYHYFSISLANAFPIQGVTLTTFLHDSWMEKTNDSIEKQNRIKFGNRLLTKSNHILSVTKELACLYSESIDDSKLHVHFPIPHGIENSKLIWRDSYSNSIHIVYAGTIESHHLIIFEKIAKAFNGTSNQFTIVSNGIEGCQFLLKYNPALILKAPFEKNQEVLEYMNDNASVILVNYGLNVTQNPYAASSFPSKFVEYCSLNIPIICIAPSSSPFYRFLKKNNWTLLFCDENQSNLETQIYALKERDIWEKNAIQTSNIYKQYFESEMIQTQFESLIFEEE